MKLYKHQILQSSLYAMKEWCYSPWTHSCGSSLHFVWNTLETCIVKTLLKERKERKQYTFLIHLKYFIIRKTKSIPLSLNEVIEYVPESFQSHECSTELAASCVMWEPPLLPMKTDKLGDTSPPRDPNWPLAFPPPCSHLVFLSIFSTAKFQNVSSQVYILL